MLARFEVALCRPRPACLGGTRVHNQTTIFSLRRPLPACRGGAQVRHQAAGNEPALHPGKRGGGGKTRLTIWLRTSAPPRQAGRGRKTATSKLARRANVCLRWPCSWDSTTAQGFSRVSDSCDGTSRSDNACLSLRSWGEFAYRSEECFSPSEFPLRATATFLGGEPAAGPANRVAQWPPPWQPDPR